MAISKKNLKIADELKALGHGVRLQILEELIRANGECNVSSLQKIVKISQSALSQHLSLLKTRGFVLSKTSGVERLYSIKDNRIKKYLANIISFSG